MASIHVPSLNTTIPVPPFVLSTVEGVLGQVTLGALLSSLKHLTFVISQKCTESLLLNLNFRDVECLKYALSKALGLGIVVGGSVMKLPQIIASKYTPLMRGREFCSDDLCLVLSSKSAAGLSLPSSVLSTTSYMITAAYGFKSEFPFSTYGENLFLSVQDAIVTLLILSFTSPSSKTSLPLTSALLLGSASFLYATDLHTLSMLQVATIPLSIGSKIPQIVQNYKRKDTGMLSGVVVWTQVLGTIARLYTTMAELSSPAILVSFSAALVLNIVLAVQILLYGSKGAGVKQVVSEKPQTEDGFAKDVRPERPATPASRSGTPVPGQSGGGGKKWARKLD